LPGKEEASTSETIWCQKNS